jgi:hypothetical protein
MRWGVALWIGLALPPVVAHAEPPETALVGPVQGSPEVRHAYAARVHRALVHSLEARGYAVLDDPAAGEALVACASVECVTDTLDLAGAPYGWVPAMWVRTGTRRELTLTLVQKSGRSLNAGTVINGDLSSITASLVDELLHRVDDGEHPSVETDAPPGLVAKAISVPSSHDPASNVVSDEPATGRAHAWMAGPIVLWAGGGAIFIAIGAAAAMRDDDQRLNEGAVVGWSILGVAALATGTAWWVVGSRRRSSKGRAGRQAAIGVSPSGFDLRVRF